MKTILLTQGKVALVDDQDYNWLNQWKWHALQDRHTFYAVRHIRVAKNKRTLELMHRLILGLQPSDDLETDHIDGDGWNNQIANLRACTRMQNQQSQRPQKNGTSKYKGVSWHRNNGNWQSMIKVNGRQLYLGSFSSEKLAAQIYNQAALKHFGNFALLNTI